MSLTSYRAAPPREPFTYMMPETSQEASDIISSVTQV
jgi:hypothetical protein